MRTATTAGPCVTTAQRSRLSRRVQWCEVGLGRVGAIRATVIREVGLTVGVAVAVGVAVGVGVTGVGMESARGLDPAEPAAARAVGAWQWQWQRQGQG